MSRKTKLVGLLTNKLEEALRQQGADLRTIPRDILRRAAETVLKVLQFNRCLDEEVIEHALRPEIAGDEQDIVFAQINNTAAELLAAAERQQ